MKLGMLDAVIMVAYLAATAIIGFVAGRREKTDSREYFLAGSRLPWYAVGMSMVAASISTEQFIGEVGFAYTYGLAVANWEWLIFPALTLLIWIFTPFFVRCHVTTMPEFLERRYGPESRTIFAVLTIVSYTAVNLAMVLYSGGLLLQELFGLNIWICIVLLAVVTGAYTVYGGLSSVAWTDAFQCVLLLLGGLLVFGLGLYRVEGGWDAIVGTGDRAHLILPPDHPDLPWPAMLALALVTNTWYYCTNQYINQRCLGAKDEWHAKMGMVLCGFLGILLAFSVSFPGLIAYAMNPHLSNPNTAYPYLVTNLLPPALQGIVLAGLVAAIMSTISSLVNSAATVYTIDIYKRFFAPHVEETRLVVAGRWSGTVILIVGLVCAPIVGQWEHIFRYCQDVWVLMAGPTVAVFVLGVLWRGATRTAATVTMLLSFPLVTIPYVQKISPILTGAFANALVLGGLVCILCFVVMIVVSLLTREKPKEEALALHWTPAMLALPGDVAARHSAWYKRIGLWWLILGAFYGAIYVTFW